MMELMELDPVLVPSLEKTEFYKKRKIGGFLKSGGRRG
jgi:hypothetical protein